MKRWWIRPSRCCSATVRVTYRLLQRHFRLDDAALEDLREELIYGQRVAVDEEERVLVWRKRDGIRYSLGLCAGAGPMPARHVHPSPTCPRSWRIKFALHAATLEGERKHVTVLFADLKDSTELIRDLDPEAAQQLLDPALQRMIDAVHRFEGTVNQVLGDGIMALFGAPIAHEDHALRACYAALAMQAELRRYAEAVRRTQGRWRCRLRVGLHSGEVVVRAIGNDLHMDYSAVGETTVTGGADGTDGDAGHAFASTPATLAPGGGVGQGTLARDLSPVKGLVEPMEVFELIGASGVRRRLQALRAGPDALCRAGGQELVVMQQALARAERRARPDGRPGRGARGWASRAWSTSGRTPTARQGWRVLESASVSYGKAMPYFAGDRSAQALLPDRRQR